MANLLEFNSNILTYFQKGHSRIVSITYANLVGSFICMNKVVPSKLTHLNSSYSGVISREAIF